MPPLRAAIAGTGFIGAVHARSARLAGARVVGVAASSPETARQAAARPRRRARVRLRRGAGRRRGRRRRPHLHAEPSARPARRGSARGGQARDLREAARPRPGRARTASSTRRTRQGVVAAVPFVYRYYPTVREARERVRDGRTGALRLVHGSYLQDWLLRPDDDNWRVDARLGGASRAFADIGSHWCDLAEFVSGHRIARLSARLLTAVPERVGAAGRKAFARGRRTGRGAAGRRPRTPRSSSSRPTAARSAQRSSARSRRAARTGSGSSSTAPTRRSPSTRRRPEELWCGRREAATILRRDPATLSPAAARFAFLPGGHPQGYADCFDAFVADVYESVASGRRPSTGCRRSPTACARRSSPTPCSRPRARRAGSTWPAPVGSAAPR